MLQTEAHVGITEGGVVQDGAAFHQGLGRGQRKDGQPGFSVRAGFRQRRMGAREMFNEVGQAIVIKVGVIGPPTGSIGNSKVGLAPSLQRGQAGSGNQGDFEAGDRIKSAFAGRKTKVTPEGCDLIVKQETIWRAAVAEKTKLFRARRFSGQDSAIARGHSTRVSRGWNSGQAGKSIFQNMAAEMRSPTATTMPRTAAWGIFWE